jgi:hypothetical protein
VRLEELWVEPADIESRDLFYGVGGSELAPTQDALFRLKDRETKGFSGGYDVVDAQGRDWDVKIGPEAQTEVMTSRVLWAVGYHQPPTYYLASWRVDGGDGAPPPGRFRPEWGRHIEGEWSWKENPFAGTPALRALLVINVLLNNWDLKTSNNLIYRFDTPAGGLERWFVIQDLGATLGRTASTPPGTRNDLEDFEKEGFVRLADGRLQFEYHGKQGDLLRDVTPGDVAWACRLLSRLTDAQWNDAFRAAGYDPETTSRFMKKIGQKISLGLQVAPKESASRTPGPWRP